MFEAKKIVTTLVKIIIGVLSLGIIYYKLKADFTADKIAILYSILFTVKGVVCIILCLLLIPINWGIESYKWKIITQPVEEISFKTAMQSVYSGVCLGNLAPGRATEFIAKIYFFKIENRSQIAVLHFVGGMFQLAISIVFGLVALFFKFKNFNADNVWIAYLVSVLAVVVFGFFVLCLFKLPKILAFVYKKISKQKNINSGFNYVFTKSQLFKLIAFSTIRYFVFSVQLFLLLFLFYQGPFSLQIVFGIWLYFLIVSIVPMISFIEAAIRAAVALIVFKDCGISNAALALASILIWILNIVVPSIAGYFILIKQNFNFKISKQKK